MQTDDDAKTTSMEDDSGMVLADRRVNLVERPRPIRPCLYRTETRLPEVVENASHYNAL